MPNNQVQLSIGDIANSIKTEIKVNKNGQCFLSKRGFSRLTGIHMSNLIGRALSPKLSQKLTHHGMNPESFAENGIPDVALSLMVDFYAREADQKSFQCQQISDFLAASGTRLTLQKLAGWVDNPNFIPEVSAKQLSLAYAKLAESEETVEIMTPAYAYIQSRPNLKQLTETTKPDKLALSSSNLLTSREIKDVLGLGCSHIAISRHLAAIWRSENGTKLTSKVSMKKDKSGNKSSRRTLVFPLVWASEKIRLLTNAVN